MADCKLFTCPFQAMGYGSMHINLHPTFCSPMSLPHREQSSTMPCLELPGRQTRPSNPLPSADPAGVAKPINAGETRWPRGESSSGTTSAVNHHLAGHPAVQQLLCPEHMPHKLLIAPEQDTLPQESDNNALNVLKAHLTSCIIIV